MSFNPKLWLAVKNHLHAIEQCKMVYLQCEISLSAQIFNTNHESESADTQNLFEFKQWAIFQSQMSGREFGFDEN